MSSDRKIIMETSKKLWAKCPKCELFIERERLKRNMGICSSCGAHKRIGVNDRINYLFDGGLFREKKASIKSNDPISFPMDNYGGKIDKLEKESMVFGEGFINGQGCVAAIMDFEVYGGSLGVVAGEVFFRACSLSVELGLPLLVVTASGGARMQEGTAALVQMAKTIAALKMLEDEMLAFIALLCDPTCGGVTASFASAADFIIAEPGALICFSGPKVVEQTTGVSIPDGFCQAETLHEKGFVDMVVSRMRQKDVIGDLLRLLSNASGNRCGE